MSRFPEQTLWDNLSEVMTPYWFARRIEDRLGGGLPDVSFTANKKRFSWLELKVLSNLPAENRVFDIPKFTADQRGFGLECLRHGGASSWWLMTRCGDVDHLHRATIIDDLGVIKYSLWRNKAAWVGRVDFNTASAIAKVLLG